MDHDLGGVTINSRCSTTREAGEDILLLDNGSQQHACLVKYPGQRIPLLDLGIHTANGVRLQHDGGCLVRFNFAEGRTIRVLFHACDVKKHSFFLVVSLSRSIGVIFELTQVTLLS